MESLGGRRLQHLTLFVALALLFLALVDSMKAAESMRELEKAAGNVKTVCVGRFLIDIPSEAQYSLSRAVVSGYDVSTSVQETDEEFAARLQKLEQEISSSLNEAGRPSLESVQTLLLGAGKAKVFVYNRRRERTLKDDRIVPIESFDVRAMLRLPGLSVTARADGMDLNSGRELALLLGRFQPIAAGLPPPVPGFCLDHAIVRDPYPSPEGESVVMFAGLPGHPDLNIVFSSLAGSAPAPGLLARDAAVEGRMPPLSRLAFTTLRRRERIVNGLHGEELLLRVREANFTSGYDFQWEMAGKEDDILNPLLTLELESGTNPVNGGKPVQSSLPEDAMLHLWERISSSIRMRLIAAPERTAAAN